MRITAHWIREYEGKWLAFVGGQDIMGERTFDTEVAARLWVEQMLQLVNFDYDEQKAIEKVAEYILNVNYTRILEVDKPILTLIKGNSNGRNT